MGKRLVTQKKFVGDVSSKSKNLENRTIKTNSENKHKLKWKKVEKDFWKLEDGEYSVSVYGERGYDWTAELLDKDEKPIATLCTIVYGSGQHDAIGGTGQTKSKLYNQLSKILPLLSSKEEIELLLKVNELDQPMVLTKCIESGLTISEWFKSSEAKEYGYHIEE
jgi:hypothetical protein